MTLAERGLYWELIDYCTTEGSFPLDFKIMAGIAACSEDEIAQLWPNIAHKFVQHGKTSDELVHKRALEVRRKILTRKQAQSSANAGKRKKGHGVTKRVNLESTHSQPTANIVTKTSSSPSPSLYTSTSPSPSVNSQLTTNCELAFERMYALHPNKDNRYLGQQALAEAMLHIPEEKQTALLDRIERKHKAMCQTEKWTKESGKFAPALSRWFSGKGWLDEVQKPTESVSRVPDWQPPDYVKGEPR